MAQDGWSLAELSDWELVEAARQLQRIWIEASKARSDVRGTRSTRNRVLRDLEEDARSERGACEQEMIDRFFANAGRQA